jgi:hypothetical protein
MEPNAESSVVGGRPDQGPGRQSFVNPFAYCADAPAKGSVMSVLIGILITFLVVILVLYLVNMLPIDGRAKQIVRVIVIIIGILSLLKYLAVF